MDLDPLRADLGPRRFRAIDSRLMSEVLGLTFRHELANSRFSLFPRRLSRGFAAFRFGARGLRFSAFGGRFVVFLGYLGE